jgi:hypothetical protein
MMVPRYCTCLEAAFQQEVPVWHNCEYIAERNKLIPDAEAQAKAMSKVGGKLDQNRFTYLFSKFMDQAALEAGLL